MTRTPADLRDIFCADHQRGCQGREYTCSCDYDRKKDELVTKAADEIERLEEEVFQYKRSDFSGQEQIAELESRLATIERETREACAKICDQSRDLHTETMKRVPDDVKHVRLLRADEAGWLGRRIRASTLTSPDGTDISEQLRDGNEQARDAASTRGYKLHPKLATSPDGKGE